MSRQRRIKLANDNTPEQALPDTENTAGQFIAPFTKMRGRKGHSRIESRTLPRAPIQYNTPYSTQNTRAIPEAAPNYAPSEMQSANAQAERGTPWGIILSLLATITCLSLAAASFYTGQSERLSIIALFATVWSGLWTSYLAFQDGQTQKTKRAGEWSIIVAAFAGLGIWISTTREWGLPISPADGAAIAAGLTVIISVLLRARLALLASACAALAWVVLNIYMPTLNTLSIWAFPVLASLQLLLAGRMGSKFTAFLTLLAAHIWLGWTLFGFIQSGDISLLHSAAIITMIGMAHYRLGKAAGDAGWTTSNLHVVTGWGVTLIGLMALQHYWLGMETPLWDNISATPAGHLAWQIVGAASIALVGLAGLIRLYYRRLSALGALLTLLTALVAALIFDQRETIINSSELGLYTAAKPLVGIMIGAAILASAAAMSINGARRQSSAMLLAGLTAIAAQIMLLLSPQLWSMESIALFGLTLTTSFLLAALFANDSSSYARGRLAAA